MERIFVVNLGTTSFKFKLYAFEGQKEDCLAGGEIEGVLAESGHYLLYGQGGTWEEGEFACPDHEAAFTFCVQKLKQKGILECMESLSAVGYKAVHGGRISGTCLADEEVFAQMERMIPLAPAHNPVYLQAMRAVRARYPKLLQAVRFETSFHASIPDCRTAYGVPHVWREEAGIRKYGFHGSSHEYIAGAVRGCDPEARRVISCHLGGSSSICAILDGKSIAATMGATPQSGLFHNNRVGEFDVFCLPMVMERYGYDLEEILEILSSKSGLLGLSGVSNDMREVLGAAKGGNSLAQLAVRTFVDNIVGYIGMYTAYLGGLDALVFTGGIGERSSVLRAEICERLSWLGICLDEEANESFGDGKISRENSKAAVWRLKTNEELVVARNIHKHLKDLREKGTRC